LVRAQLVCDASCNRVRSDARAVCYGQGRPRSALREARAALELKEQTWEREAMYAISRVRDRARYVVKAEVNLDELLAKTTIAAEQFYTLRNIRKLFVAIATSTLFDSSNPLAVSRVTMPASNGTSEK
jgi:hypothetical protein